MSVNAEQRGTSPGDGPMSSEVCPSGEEQKVKKIQNPKPRQIYSAKDWNLWTRV